MNKVVAFGEIMLRLSTEKHLRFTQARSFAASYGGSEFNVLASLANHGTNTSFITRLPNNEISNCVLEEMRKLNIDSQHIIFGGECLGICFLETGIETRRSNVVYNRANSAIATIQEGSINWVDVLKDATWFHWSGITPAISQNAANECLKAVKTAHKLGITISSDLNYRSKLWRYGKKPCDIMPELLQYSTIILGDIDSAYFMLGKDKVSPDYQDEESLPILYDQLFNLCSNLKMVATTLRYSISASHQRIGGILYDGTTLYNTEIREITSVVDRIGSGDAFMGGLIYGILNYKENKQKILDFAVASCSLKHTISGDYNLTTVEEVENMILGETESSISK